MKEKDLGEAVRLHDHLDDLRVALESVPKDEHVRLSYQGGLHEFDISYDVFVDCIKEDIGRTKKQLRKLGVEFAGDKE